MAALLVVRNPIRNAALQSGPGPRGDDAGPGHLGSLPTLLRARAPGSADAGRRVRQHVGQPPRTNAEIVQIPSPPRRPVTPEAEASASTGSNSSLRHQKDEADEYSELAAVQREMFDQLAPERLSRVVATADDLSTAPGVGRRHPCRPAQIRSACPQTPRIRSTPLYRFGSGVRKVVRRLPGRSGDPSAAS